MFNAIIDFYNKYDVCQINSTLCQYDKSLTLTSSIIIVSILIFVASTYIFLSKRLDRLFYRYSIMAGGVLMFELFTAPMWNNAHFGRFGYYYLDISWILTLCWTSMFLLNIYIVDSVFPKKKERQRFFLYLIIPLLFTIWGELLLVMAGVRSYAPEIMQASVTLIGGVPIEILYYAPVFSTFIMCFYKYWMFQLQKKPIVPMKRKVTVRNFIISFIGIFIFELLIDPIVHNNNFPSWSYLYGDISFVRIGIWIALIVVGTTFVDKLFINISQATKYLLYITCISLVFYQVESWLITNNYRVYSESATNNFSGFLTPLSSIPIEVAFAIMLYVALIISFIRYWRIVWDNKL